ncbi:MAG: phosphomethylpyrimidine synthase ThiC [Candidatus Omnitrophica bacterium]|nr:phosphomethylpyrimidine synthase ThiC [Candidatus Omnitrophota bacterium]
MMIKVNEKVIRKASVLEDATISDIKTGLKQGTVVVPANKNRRIKRPCAIGNGMTTKVNANIGLSPGHSGIDEEMRKLKTAVEAGADTVMDLSTGPLLKKLRKKVLRESSVPVGTVPVYEVACMSANRIAMLKEQDFIDVLLEQAENGVDFFTIHSGITLEALSLASRDPRIMNIVSRGGALIASWMRANNRENPFLTRFDDVIKLCGKYNITLSLGDSLRPGSIHDATDQLQLRELLVLGQQQRRAFQSGVQVMIEGPGHVPLDQIKANVQLQKSICHGAPFYVLGPLVTDAAPGYDHITGAIGGAIAASAGADFLCYVTPAEHVCLPREDDVRRGVIASRIAAHSGDIVKGIPSALNRDRMISEARAKRDWKKQFSLAIDPQEPMRGREASRPAGAEEDVCTMCSEYCSIKVTEESLAEKKDKSGQKRGEPAVKKTAGKKVTRKYGRSRKKRK